MLRGNAVPYQNVRKGKLFSNFKRIDEERHILVAEICEATKKNKVDQKRNQVENSEW